MNLTEELDQNDKDQPPLGITARRIALFVESALQQAMETLLTDPNQSESVVSDRFIRESILIRKSLRLLDDHEYFEEIERAEAGLRKALLAEASGAYRLPEKDLKLHTAVHYEIRYGRRIVMRRTEDQLTHMLREATDLMRQVRFLERDKNHARQEKE